MICSLCKKVEAQKEFSGKTYLCPQCHQLCANYVATVFEAALRGDIYPQGGKALGRPKIRNDDRIRSLREDGYSIRQIAKITGFSKGGVERGLKGYS